jgi:hypothetical protein
LSGNTKATLTVERNPAGHIMDGLLRRWDFNLFRNGRWKPKSLFYVSRMPWYFVLYLR